MAQENIGKRFDGYQIYDQHYEKVGKVDDLFVDENDVPEYIGLKTSLFGGPSTLIPMDIVRVNDVRQLVEVASDKDTINNAPSFDEDAEITAEFEDRVYAHFGARSSHLRRTGADTAPTTTKSPTWMWHTGRSLAPEYGSTLGNAGRVPGRRPRSRGAAEPHRQGACLRGSGAEGARVYDWDIETERRG